MAIKPTYKHTISACFTGYITQAIVNSLAPLLFLTFQKEFSISLDKIALLVTVNFTVQLIVDLVSVKFVDKIGYRICVVAAHIFAGVGLIGMGVLPGLLPNAYAGLMAAMVLNAIGGGLIEVLISPIVEACPTKKKEAAMSLLHSFFSWGQVGVVGLSTLYFTLAGIENWRLLTCLWALIPLCNAVFFCFVPINTLVANHERISLKKLLTNRVFWVLMLLMLCTGASEQSMGQWASAFAESGLGVSKTVGDLAGPCLFAILMGLSRVFYAKFSEKINLEKFMAGSSILCVTTYVIAVFSPSPILSLMGCAFCGMSVGILWPGTFSVAAKAIPNGGTALFALLALAGDLGCSVGPTMVGVVSQSMDNNLKKGLVLAILFPLLLLLGLLLLKIFRKKNPTINSTKSSLGRPL